MSGADEPAEPAAAAQQLLLFSIQPGRLVGASATVLLTTLEDGVWLVPLVARAASRTAAIAHAATFVATFTLLSLSVGMIAALLLQRTQQVERLEQQHRDALLSAAGAALCWAIAAVLCCRAWRQQRRRRRRQSELQRQRSEAETAALFAPVDSTRDAPTAAALPVYGSVESLGDEEDDENENENDGDRSEGGNPLQIWLVISLTIVGAIDEVSYFPALIVGGVFSVAELTLGTALASLLILLIVTVALAPCGPVLQFLDRVPLYAVVAFFAVLLSLNAAWQYFCHERE